MEQKNQMQLKSAIYAQYRKQKELAAAMSWDERKLTRIISGRQAPKVSELADMAKALGMSLDKMAVFFLPE